MTNSIQKQNTLDSDNKEQNFGQILRQKREEKKLSLNDVYEQIRINKRVLQAFENNNFSDSIDEYTDPVYLRAYLQKYCLFLGLEDNIFVKFNIYPSTKTKKNVDSAKDNSVNIPLGSVAIAEQNRSNKGRIIVFSIITLGILFSVIFIIWNSLETNSSKDSGVIDHSSMVVEKTLPLEEKQTVDIKEVEEPIVLPKPLDSTVEKSDNVSNSSSTAVSTEENKDSNQETKELNTNTEEKLVTENLETKNTTVSSDKDASTSLIPERGIYLKTERKDVWMGVKVEKRWIKTQTVKKGEDFTYLVPSSYSKYLIKLGVAKGVTIYINGKEIDFPTSSDKGVTIVVNGNDISIQ